MHITAAYSIIHYLIFSSSFKVIEYTAQPSIRITNFFTEDNT